MKGMGNEGEGEWGKGEMRRVTEKGNGGVKG